MLPFIAVSAGACNPAGENRLGLWMRKATKWRRPALTVRANEARTRRNTMNRLIYLIGLIVVIGFILSFLGIF